MTCRSGRARPGGIDDAGVARQQRRRCDPLVRRRPARPARGDGNSRPRSAQRVLPRQRERGRAERRRAPGVAHRAQDRHRGAVPDTDAGGRRRRILSGRRAGACREGLGAVVRWPAALDHRGGRGRRRRGRRLLEPRPTSGGSAARARDRGRVGGHAGPAASRCPHRFRRPRRRRGARGGQFALDRPEASPPHEHPRS